MCRLYATRCHTKELLSRVRLRAHFYIQRLTDIGTITPRVCVCLVYPVKTQGRGKKFPLQTVKLIYHTLTPRGEFDHLPADFFLTKHVMRTAGNNPKHGVPYTVYVHNTYVRPS